MTDFTDEQIERYSRHIILPEVGGVGQRKMLDARVLMIGAGGLGSPAATISLQLESAISVSWISTQWTSVICRDRSSIPPNGLEC